MPQKFLNEWVIKVFHIRDRAKGIYKIIYDISNTNDSPFINGAVFCDYSLYASPVVNNAVFRGIACCSYVSLSYPHILIVPFQTFTLSGHQSQVYGSWCMSLSCNNRLGFALQAQHHLWGTHLTAINHAGSHLTEALSPSLHLSPQHTHTHTCWYLHLSEEDRS